MVLKVGSKYKLIESDPFQLDIEGYRDQVRTYNAASAPENERSENGLTYFEKSTKLLLQREFIDVKLMNELLANVKKLESSSARNNNQSPSNLNTRLLSLLLDAKNKFYDNVILRHLLGNLKENMKRQVFDFVTVDPMQDYALMVSKFVYMCFESTRKSNDLLKLSENSKLLLNASTPESIDIFGFLIDVLRTSFNMSVQHTDISIIRFIYLVNCKVSGEEQINVQFYHANSITKWFAAFEFVLKIAIMNHAAELTSRPEQESSIENLYTKNVIFESIILVHAKLQELAQREISLPTVFEVKGEPDKIRVANRQILIANLYLSIQRWYDKCIQKYNALTNNFGIKKIRSGLEDLHQCSDLTYSFLHSSSNNIMFLYEQLALHLKVCNFSVNNAWLEEVKKFELDLLILIHLTYGAPARATELMQIKLFNSNDGIRNIYLDGTQFLIFLSYSKTGSRAPIVRYLPVNVSTLLYNFIVYLDGARRLFLATTGMGNVSEYLFSSQAENQFEPFYRHFQTVFTPTCEVEIGIKLYRHICKYLFRTCLSDGDNTPLLKECGLMDEQFGHSEDIANRIYAVPSSTPYAISTQKIADFRNISNLWHKLIGMENSLNDLNSTLPILKKSTALELKFRNSLKGSLSADAEEANIAPISNFSHNLSQVNLGAGLKKMLKSNEVYFKSESQMTAVQASYDGDRDLAIVLPTAHGKSMCYFLPAFLNPHECNLVFSPLISLTSSIEEKCKLFGIKYINYENQLTPPAAITICHYQKVHEIKDLQQWIGKTKIRRIFIDEAHLLFSFYTLMKLSNFSFIRGDMGIPLILLSATFPIHIRGFVKDIFGGLPMMHSIVDRSERPNLIFNVFRFDNNTLMEEKIDEIMHFIIKEPKIKKCILFFYSLDILKAYAGDNNFIFDGKLNMQAKINVIEEWKNSENKFIFSTSALLSGFDLQDVNAVIIVGGFSNLLDVIQGFGRCGRDGISVGYCYALTSNGLEIGLQNSIQNKIEFDIVKDFFVTKSCLRAFMSNYLHSTLATCSALKCLECSNCSKNSSKWLESSDALSFVDDITIPNHTKVSSPILTNLSQHNQKVQHEEESLKRKPQSPIDFDKSNKQHRPNSYLPSLFNKNSSFNPTQGLVKVSEKIQTITTKSSNLRSPYIDSNIQINLQSNLENLAKEIETRSAFNLIKSKCLNCFFNSKIHLHSITKCPELKSACLRCHSMKHFSSKCNIESHNVAGICYQCKFSFSRRDHDEECTDSRGILEQTVITLFRFKQNLDEHFKNQFPNAFRDDLKLVQFRNELFLKPEELIKIITSIYSLKK